MNLSHTIKPMKIIQYNCELRQGRKFSLNAELWHLCELEKRILCLSD